MTDPFHDLHEPDRPVDPDPDFANRLRARIERALALPEGVTPVSAESVAAETVTPEFEIHPEVDVPAHGAGVPYLTVADARAAIAWYIDIFGARLTEAPYDMPDGRIGHADLSFPTGHVYLADAYPELGITAPRPGEANVTLMLPVDDADAVRERAVAAGANGDRPPYDGYGSRNATIVDPFGHRWGLTSPLRAAGPVAHRHGDVVHIALLTPDPARTRVFYTDVLGWDYGDDGRVQESEPSIGFREGEAKLMCAYAVNGLEAALARLISAGGTAGEIERYPWGAVAECTDDQGTPLRLHELDYHQGSAAGPNPGRLSGISLEVPDPMRARGFYAAVLGWETVEAAERGTWSVVGTTVPVSLAAGGSGAVPVFTVDDLTAAVERIRIDGGVVAGAPAADECTDPQGLRFRIASS